MVKVWQNYEMVMRNFMMEKVNQMYGSQSNSTNIKLITILFIVSSQSESLALLTSLNILGPGANAGEGAFLQQIEAATVAKECLLAMLKSDIRSGTIWVNLANAYYVLGDHRSAKKCLEKVVFVVSLLTNPVLEPGLWFT